jgi:5-(carboxyamino)imidazole ribonucleotide mutase
LETRKAPPPYDKQFVRAWGIEQGINKRKPNNADDVAWVHSLQVPQNLIEQTTRIYRYIFWRLTGSTIEGYLRYKMGVNVSVRIPRIAVVCGSESDLSVVRPVLANYAKDTARISASVMSCHQNPHDVVGYSENGSDADAIICVGGKAFALPGIVDAFAHAAKKDVPIIGVALGELGSKSLLAAQLSIEELPGSPVIMDEINGGVYTGAEGLCAAINRVIVGELPPPKSRTEKPVQLDVFRNF